MTIIITNTTKHTKNTMAARARRLETRGGPMAVRRHLAADNNDNNSNNRNDDKYDDDNDNNQSNHIISNMIL